MLKERNPNLNNEAADCSPVIKALEERLQSSVQPSDLKTDSLIHSGSVKMGRDQSYLRFTSKRFKTPRAHCSQPRMTF